MVPHNTISNALSMTMKISPSLYRDIKLYHNHISQENNPKQYMKHCPTSVHEMYFIQILNSFS